MPRDRICATGCRNCGRVNLAERLGLDSANSHLRNRLSELAAMEIVDYPARGQVALQGWVR
jgi:hypothetical protein